jgi:uncharacterized membrane protein (DUF485 family)
VTELQHQQLAELARRRWRVALILSGLMIAAYFGFILLVAFDKPLVGSLILGGNISVGIVLGALVIALAPVLTGVYIRWANREYDGQVAQLKGAIVAGQIAEHQRLVIAAAVGAGRGVSGEADDDLVPLAALRDGPATVRGEVQP